MKNMCVFKNPWIYKFEMRVATIQQGVTKNTGCKLQSTFKNLTVETKTNFFVPGWTSLDNFGLADI